MRVVEVVIAIMVLGAYASFGANAEVSPVVDLREILGTNGLDAEKAAEAGIDITEMKAPRLTKAVPPVFPTASFGGPARVRVVAECRLDVEGVPRDCRVRKSGDARLSSAALTAIEQWRYDPLKVRDEPTAALIAITVDFDKTGR